MYFDELLAAREALLSSGAEFELIETEVRGSTILDYKNRPNSVREIWLATTRFADRTFLI